MLPIYFITTEVCHSLFARAASFMTKLKFVIITRLIRVLDWYLDTVRLLRLMTYLVIVARVSFSHIHFALFYNSLAIISDFPLFLVFPV